MGEVLAKELNLDLIPGWEYQISSNSWFLNKEYSHYGNNYAFAGSQLTAQGEVSFYKHPIEWVKNNILNKFDLTSQFHMLLKQHSINKDSLFIVKSGNNDF